MDATVIHETSGPSVAVIQMAFNVKNLETTDECSELHAVFDGRVPARVPSYKLQ